MSSFFSKGCKHIVSNYTSVLQLLEIPDRRMTGIERGRCFLALISISQGNGNNGDPNNDDDNNEFLPPLSRTQSTPRPPVSSMQISTRVFFVFLKSITLAATYQKRKQNDECPLVVTGEFSWP